MSYRNDGALWNNPISNPTNSLRNAGASLTNQNSFTQGSLASTNNNQFQNFNSSNSNLQQTQPFAGPISSEGDPVDYDIYNKAISVSSPRLASVEGESQPSMVRKKIVRRVEVPFTRQVKVPTQTTQLVPTLIEQKVPVKKLVAVPGFKYVDEEYTEYEEREAVREKEVWVKKIVPERYIEKVPVHRVRQVQKPTTLIKEIETIETVQVPTTKKVLVDGFRIDQVQDSKVVEVEEYQDYELRPHPIGGPQISATNELGRLPGSRLARSIGSQVLAPNHPQLNAYEPDDLAGTVPVNTAPQTLRGSQPFQPSQGQGQGQAPPRGQSPFARTNQNPVNSVNPLAATQPQGPSPSNPYTASFYRPSSPTSANLNIHGTSSASAQQQQYGPFAGTPSTLPLNDPRAVPPAGAYRKPAVKTVDSNPTNSNNPMDPNSIVNALGLTVDDTHTRHTDGTGVVVSNIVRGGPAARAGIQVHDIITGVNGVPSSTVDEFGSLLSRSNPGPLSFNINRDGRRNITLSLYR